MAVYCFPYNREGIMYRMENEFILLEIDENGILQKLCNRKNGRNLIRPRRLFRLILGDPGWRIVHGSRWCAKCTIRFSRFAIQNR